jgi:pimeloyl-ACP methyl ester carboxylesterase
MAKDNTSRYDVKRILSTATRVPKNLDKGSLAKYTLVGSGLGALLAALATKDKNNRLRNALIAALIGGGVGAYTNIFKHNIVTEMGGHYDEDPDYYDPKKLISKLNPEQKKVLFYVMGASDRRGGHKKSEAKTEDNAFKFAYGDTKKLVNAINSVPAGYEVNVVGHSAGGGTVLQALRKLQRKVDKAVLLDAVDLDPISALQTKLSGTRRNKNVGRLINMLPGNYNLEPKRGLTMSDSDFWVGKNPLRVGVINGADENITVEGDDHSMESTGLRMSGDGRIATPKQALEALNTL